MTRCRHRTGRDRCCGRVCGHNELSFLVVSAPIEEDLLDHLLLGCRNSLSALSSRLTKRPGPCTLLSALLLALLLSGKLCLGPRLEEEARVGVVGQTAVARVHLLQERVEGRIRGAVARVLPSQRRGQVGLSNVVLIAPVERCSRLLAHCVRSVRQEEVWRTLAVVEEVLLHCGQLLLDRVDPCADRGDAIGGLLGRVSKWTCRCHPNVVG